MVPLDQPVHSETEEKDDISPVYRSLAASIEPDYEPFSHGTPTPLVSPFVSRQGSSSDSEWSGLPSAMPTPWMPHSTVCAGLFAAPTPVVSRQASTSSDVATAAPLPPSTLDSCQSDQVKGPSDVSQQVGDPLMAELTAMYRKMKVENANLAELCNDAVQGRVELSIANQGMQVSIDQLSLASEASQSESLAGYVASTATACKRQRSISTRLANPLPPRKQVSEPREPDVATLTKDQLVALLQQERTAREGYRQQMEANAREIAELQRMHEALSEQLKRLRQTQLEPRSRAPD